MTALQSKRLDPPPEPVYTGVKAVEYLRFHPAHLRNHSVTSDACSDFTAFLQSKAAELKTALQAVAEKRDAKTEAKARTAKEQLEGAIVEGLRVEPGNLFAKLSGSNKLIAILNNVLVRLVNASEANSSLAKAILRLYTRFTRMTSEQLEKLQMDKIKKKFSKEGDAETKGLMAQIYENARQNDDDGSESESDSPGAESGGRGKKAGPAQSRGASKQVAAGVDSKKTTGSSSTSRLATSTTDPKKLTSASSNSMAANTEPNKATSKAPAKMPSTATGLKRSREEDAAGAEARSSKKPATDLASASGVKVPSGAKPVAVAAGKMPATKVPTVAATSGSAATQTKPRSGLLLPGKARPAPKPAAKPEPAKAEAQKSATKPESTLKAQPTKALATPAGSGAAKIAKPKPAEAPRQSSSSIFSSLMKEIDEKEKVIKTPAANTKKVNTPDPNETPEERERRLRKEKRRGLRVAFKSGDALVEVREFTRHPEEIADGNLARNVRVDGRYKNSEESEMMKRLRGGQGIKALEVNDREWEEPSAIKFAANIPQEKMEQTFVTRGGLKTFETNEQKLTKERELNELMVIYHSRADIPPTPRSPNYEPSLSGSSAAHEVHLPPTAPEYDEMVQRGREFRQWGPYHASRAAQSRLDTKARPDYADFTKTMKSINSIADSYTGQAPRQPHQQQVLQPPAQDPRKWYEPTSAARRDQQAYELLASDRAKNWKDPDPYNQTFRRMSEEELDNDPKLQKVLAGLQAIVASLQTKRADKPAEVTPAAQPALQQAPQPAAVATQAAAPDHAAAWAQYYAAQQQQAWYGQAQNPYTQAANPYAQAPQAAQQQQQQPADPNNQYAGILAALGIQQPAAQSQAQPAADQNSQIQAALLALAASNQGQAAAPAATDPQSTQYLLDMVKLAQGQAASQPAQTAYQAPYSYGNTNPTAAQTYGQQPYGQSHQEREAYGQVYGGGNAQDRDRERDRERDAYGRDRERERERDRDRGEQREYHHQQQHHGNKPKGGGGRNGGGGGGGGGGKNENVPEHLRGINRSLIGTKACAFWAKGQCAKGDKCTFRHD